MSPGRIAAVIGIAGIAAAVSFSGPAYAVVGQAEQYDFFESEKLSDFHDSIVNQEQRRQVEAADTLRAQLQERNADLRKADGEDKDELSQEIDAMKKQLLQLPKRDRFKVEIIGNQQFDTNANRSPLNSEKNDSVLDVAGKMLFDLSGRKTDLRWEVGGGKQWSIEFPEKDTKQFQEILRFRRKFFRKISQSTQSRIVRQSSKTVEINNEKVRYDSSNSTALNYAISPKFSMNNDISMSQHIYRQEAFDQDSSWEVGYAPSVFWNLTPKSRVNLGYKIGQNRVRTKVGNAVAHEIHGGYFGRITRKSSASIDLGFSHQSPREASTASVNGVTAGVGYIWQMTPKTQILVQYINSWQNSTSKSTEGLDSAATNETQVAKTQTRFHNSSLTVSANARLNRKLTAVLTFNPYFFSTHTAGSAETDSDAHQIGIPASISVTYFVRRWLILTSSYTFTYRTGDEYGDKSRDHLIKNSARLTF